MKYAVCRHSPTGRRHLIESQSSAGSNPAVGTMDNSKTSLISVYLDQETIMKLSARAEDEGTTRSDLIREYIKEGLEKPAQAFIEYKPG